MKRGTKHTREQIVRKLREADRILDEGKPAVFQTVSGTVEISEVELDRPTNLGLKRPLVTGPKVIDHGSRKG